MTKPRRDRAGDSIRSQAYRLAVEARMGAAAIEAHLVSSGHTGVAEALTGIRAMLDAAATAPRCEKPGIRGMFPDA